MIKVFTAFSGYDSQCMALDRLGIEYDLIGWSEIDKYAIMAHNAVYPQWAERNYGDISKIDWNNVPDFDLFTYSFPCTDISSAGQQKGLSENSGTRSSLLWECKKAIEVKRPKYLLMENVKALTQKKFLPYLHKWQDFLTSMGYTNFTQVLNAKDYGVPQNRERVFMISILSDAWFSFPYPFGCQKRLKDVLESNVDEKYYLSNKAIEGFDSHKVRMQERGNGFGWNPTTGDCIASSVLTTAGSRPDDNFIKEPLTCSMRGRNPDNPSDRRKGIPTEQRIEIGGDVANCVTTVQKDSLVVEPTIIQIANIYNKDKNPQSGRIYSKDGISPTIDTMLGGNREPKIFDGEAVQNYRIRKLTPRECFRLMGVSEADIDKIQSAGISKTQQYKMAGNSIVVDVLYYIFKELFKQC